MGLDFVVLQRPDDDSPENWPGHELDSRRADDPAPFVQARLREVYDGEYSPRGMAASAEFDGWMPLSRPQRLAGLIFFPLYLLIFWPLVNWSAWRAKKRDEAREIPTFEAWKAEKMRQGPAPVVIRYGPDCPPDAETTYVAAVQWYGFRGKVVETTENPLVEWWSRKNGVDIDLMYYGEGFEDGPRTPLPASELGGLDDPTIADLAELFRVMEADCRGAFPEMSAETDAMIEKRAAAQARHRAAQLATPQVGQAPEDSEAAVETLSDDVSEASEAPASTERQPGLPYGPYPDRGLHEEAYAEHLEMIADAARFFRFWQGRGYRIAPDF